MRSLTSFMSAASKLTEVNYLSSDSDEEIQCLGRDRESIITLEEGWDSVNELSMEPVINQLQRGPGSTPPPKLNEWNCSKMRECIFLPKTKVYLPAFPKPPPTMAASDGTLSSEGEETEVIESEGENEAEEGEIRESSSPEALEAILKQNNMGLKERMEKMLEFFDAKCDAE